MPDHLMLYKMNCLVAPCSWDRKRGQFKFFLILSFPPRVKEVYRLEEMEKIFVR